MRRWASAWWAACLAVAGCSSGLAGDVAGAAKLGPGTRVVMVDVSGSAKDHWEALFPKARRLVEETRQGTRLAVFRFDVSVAEVYDGNGVLDAAEAGKLLKPLVNHQANASGTNLAPVVRRVVERAQDWPKPVVVDVVTDCGTELMSQAEREFVRTTVEAWQASGQVRLRFHGVTQGHREAIRAIAPGCEIVEH
jgi:uncharacterized protein with von Willebrand factor type A (vWA) domain